MYETNQKTPSRVRIALGYTVNMGNFESLRVDLAVEDSARMGENVNDLTERVYAYTEKKLIEKVTEIREQMGATGA